MAGASQEGGGGSGQENAHARPGTHGGCGSCVGGAGRPGRLLRKTACVGRTTELGGVVDHLTL